MYFWLFLTSWTPWFALEVIQKFKIPQLYEHTYQPCQYQIYWSSNWPCSIDCRWSRGKYGFLESSAKKILWHDWMMSHFFTLLKYCKVSSCDQAQWFQVWCKGSRFTKDYSLTGFKKNVLLAIPFPFLKTRTQSSKSTR